MLIQCRTDFLISHSRILLSLLLTVHLPSLISQKAKCFGGIDVYHSSSRCFFDQPGVDTASKRLAPDSSDSRTRSRLVPCRGSVFNRALRIRGPETKDSHEIGTRFTPAKILSRSCVCPLSSSTRTSLRLST